MGIISQSELARQAGVSKAAVSKWIKQRGIPILSDSQGHRGPDENNPDVVDYLNSPKAQRRAVHPGASKPAASSGKRPPRGDVGHGLGPDRGIIDVFDDGSNDDEEDGEPKSGSKGGRGKRGRNDKNPESYSGYETRKMKAWAEKLELQNRITRNEYVPRADVRLILAKIYSVHTSIIRPLDAKVGDQISAEFGISDQGQILRVQEIISSETYSALNQIKRQLDEFLSTYGAEALANE